jgi:alpha-beta hydrolase superfamily lysophospholipase
MITRNAFPPVFGRACLLTAVLAILAVSGARAAPETPEAARFDAHATSFNFFFKDGDMDFHFGNLVLGAAGNGGLEIGEAFYAASRITDGDAASWQTQWAALAERVAARGEAALAAGHAVSAREQFLRAANYLRFSLVSMLPDNPELLRRGARVRELMRQAGPLFDPPLQYFEVPFEGMALPGYFQAAPGKGPHKTLLMIGGGETFAEDLYFYIAPKALERGYNFVTVELPGQGLLPASGMVFRTDTFTPMKCVVDAVLSRPEVDPARLAAYGISGGGLFVPQAAQRDPRLTAIAMNSAVVDAHALFAAMPVARTTAKDMDSWSTFHAGVVKSICWRYGVPMDAPARLVDANKGNTFDPAGIAAPALIIVSEGEYRSEEVRRQQRLALDGFPNPAKKMVLTPADEGASNHCVMENRSLVGVALFDWLDDIFR